MKRHGIFRYIIITFLFTAITAIAAAQALSKYVQPELLARLRGTGELLITGDEAVLGLRPKDAVLENLQAIITARQPDILVEALYLCPLPSGTRNIIDKKETMLRVYNILRAVGSLQGIEYYSASRKRRTVLFEESWRINSPQAREKMPDERVSSIPARETLWAWQKDASLGSAVYRVDYSGTGESLAGIFSNQTDIKLGPIILAKKQAVEMHLYAFMSDEGILLYLVAHAKIAVLPGLSGKFKDSLENRLKALHSWFSASLIRDSVAN